MEGRQTLEERNTIALEELVQSLNDLFDVLDRIAVALNARGVEAKP
jgi:hypothetical protein